MSKLSKLRSVGKEIELSNGEKVTLSAATIDVEAEMATIQSKDKHSTVKAISILVKDALKRAIPDATDEEINNLNKKDLGLITKTVLKLNMLSGDDEDKDGKKSNPKKSSA